MQAPTSLGPALRRLMLAEADLSHLHLGELHYPTHVIENFFQKDLVQAAKEAELDLALDLVRCHGDGVTVRGTVSFPARLALGPVRQTLEKTAPFVWEMVHEAVVCAGFDVTFRLEKVDLKQPPGSLFAALRFDELGVLRVGDLSLTILGKLPLLKNYLGTEALEEAGMRWLSKHIQHQPTEGDQREFFLGSVAPLRASLERRMDFLGYALRWPDVFEHVRAQHSHHGITVRVDLNELVISELARRFVHSKLLKEQVAPAPAKIKKPAAKITPAKAKKPAAKKSAAKAKPAPKTKPVAARPARKKPKGL